MTFRGKEGRYKTHKPKKRRILSSDIAAISVAKLVAYQGFNAQDLAFNLNMRVTAQLMGELNQLPERERQILEVATQFVDVSAPLFIKIIEEDGTVRYDDGGLPPGLIAVTMLERDKAGKCLDAKFIEQVASLVTHHRDDDATEPLLRSLIETNLLVRLRQTEPLSDEIREKAREVFLTAGGKTLFKAFLLERKGIFLESVPGDTPELSPSDSPESDS